MPKRSLQLRLDGVAYTSRANDPEQNQNFGVEMLIESRVIKVFDEEVEYGNRQGQNIRVSIVVFEKITYRV